MSLYRVETQEIVYTSYEIEADSEEKARQLTQDGEVPLPYTQVGEDLTIIDVWEIKS
jgi:hypothetical protein